MLVLVATVLAESSSALLFGRRPTSTSPEDRSQQAPIPKAMQICLGQCSNDHNICTRDPFSHSKDGERKCIDQYVSCWHACDMQQHMA